MYSLNKYIIYIAVIFTAMLFDMAVIDGSGYIKATAQAQTVNQSESETDEVVISFGDSLYISLPGEDGFNELIQVNRGGEINLPEIGEIKIEGMTIQGAIDLVKKKLSTAFLDLDKFNIILKKRNLPVTVLGLSLIHI